MTEIEILSEINRLSNNSGLVRIDDLRERIPIPFLEKNLNIMAEQGLIFRQIGIDHSWYGLTPQGHGKLDQFTNEHTQQKRNRIFDVLLVLLGVALTIIVEHFAAIAEFVSGLFRKQ